MSSLRTRLIKNQCSVRAANLFLDMEGSQSGLIIEYCKINGRGAIEIGMLEAGRHHSWRRQLAYTISWRLTRAFLLLQAFPTQSAFIWTSKWKGSGRPWWRQMTRIFCNLAHNHAFDLEDAAGQPGWAERWVGRKPLEEKMPRRLFVNRKQRPMF